MDKHNNEYKLLKILIKSKYQTIDISNLNMEFVIYNDLFLEFLTGDILITDSLNLVKRLPIVGGEEIILEYQDQYNHPPVKLSFIVWKVDKQEAQSQSNQIYKLKLVSPNWYRSMSMKNLKRIKGNSAGEISKLLGDTAMPVKYPHSYSVGNGPPPIDIYGSAKMPFEVIRDIVFNSHDGKDNPWLMYHTLYNYTFISLTEMINKAIYIEVYLEPLHQEKYVIDKTRISDDWFRLGNQNKVHIDQKGSQRTDNYILSLTKKNLHFSDWDYERDFGSLSTLENVPLDRIDKPKFKERCFIDDDTNIAKQANIRTAIFTMMEDNVLYVNLSGDSLYAPGQIIKMDIPSKETFMKGYKYEEDLSGRFLITSTKHFIKRDSYRTVVEVMKESLVRRL
jgi:hypothetical protein